MSFPSKTYHLSLVTQDFIPWNRNPMTTNCLESFDLMPVCCILRGSSHPPSPSSRIQLLFSVVHIAGTKSRLWPFNSSITNIGSCAISLEAGCYASSESLNLQD